MLKRSRASSSKPVSKTANRHGKRAIATDVQKYSPDLHTRILNAHVDDNVLDLSKASDFYQKEAAVAEVLADYVEKVPDSRYRLKNGFEAFFRGSLQVFLARHPAQPADALADALFQLARRWAELMRVDSLPGDRHTSPFAAFDSEWQQSWKRMPKKEWDAFQQMSQPLASYLLTAFDHTRTVDDDLTYVPTARHVELGIWFAQDLQQAPEMRILIKGDPAVSFMIAYIRKSQQQEWTRDDKKEIDYLRRILVSSVSRIEKEFLGLTRETKGRPRGVGERAAYLLYHERRPVRLVSRELCADRQKRDHICGSKCSDKIKKAAVNHFKHLRKELQSLVKSSRKEIS
jgi:hypothetical protein